MPEGPGIQKSKRVGNGDPVVPAQGGSLCADIISVNLQIQAFFLHIFGNARILFAHHIHVPLKNDRLRILVSFRCLLDNDYIIQGILVHLQIAILCELNEIITDRLLMIGRARNFRQLLKEIKHTLRFKLFQYSHFAAFPVLLLCFFRSACSHIQYNADHAES